MMNEKLGIVVITKNKYIKNIITDGDLRRIINSPSKDRKLNNLKRDYPFVINENMSASKALGLMSEKKLLVC